MSAINNIIILILINIFIIFFLRLLNIAIFYKIKY